MRKLSILFLHFYFLIQLYSCKYIDGLHIIGNKIYNADNQIVTLRGVTKSGTEFACISNYGIFDGPYNATMVEVIKSWNVNIVRIPLNEDCWLGINGVQPQYGGQSYQNAIRQWSDLLYSYGIASIIDLHWSAPGSIQAKGQYPMPDTDHSIEFWRQVANAYKGDSHVILEPFNEPFPDNNSVNSNEAWECWKNGGNCTDIGYSVAGMQTLVNAIRSTGAKNIIALGGINYSNSLNQWLTYKPTDSLNQLAAVWHSYSNTHCNNLDCWNQFVKPVTSSVPLITTEIGEYDCADGYINQIMPFLDSVGAQYLAWTFNTWNCDSGPSLISDYNGTATNYGIGYKEHIKKFKYE